MNRTYILLQHLDRMLLLLLMIQTLLRVPDQRLLLRHKLGERLVLYVELVHLIAEFNFG